MKLRQVIAGFALAILLTSTSTIFTSCEGNGDVGSTLIEDVLAINIDSTSFTLKDCRTVKTAPQRSRTTDQLIGNIDIPTFGKLKSNVVTQFLASTVLDTVHFRPQDIDSMYINFRYTPGAFIGDSIVPMGVKVYELTKDFRQEDAMTDFNPEGYYDPAKPIGTAVYNASTMESDSVHKLAYRYIRVELDTLFAQRLFKKFVDDNSSYATPESFAKEVCKGLYIENTFGSGRLTQITRTTMTMFLRRYKFNTETMRMDTLKASHDYFLVTPEVLSNNNINLEISDNIKQMVADGKNIMLAPAGYEIEMTIPANEILTKYKDESVKSTAVVNGLSVTIPADSIANGFGIAPPPYVLMVLKSERDEFFKKNKLTDNITSFYAPYNATTKSYNFLKMRRYILDLLEKDSEDGGIKPEDCEFVLCPINVEFGDLATSYNQSNTKEEIGIVPYVSAPAMAEFHLDKAQIKFTYSLHSREK